MFPSNWDRCGGHGLYLSITMDFVGSVTFSFEREILIGCVTLSRCDPVNNSTTSRATLAHSQEKHREHNGTARNHNTSHTEPPADGSTELSIPAQFNARFHTSAPALTGLLFQESHVN